MHIEQTDAGTWRVQVRHGGRRASGTYPTKREAQRRGAHLLLELGGSPTAITSTVGDIVADFVADLAVTRSPTYASDMTRVGDRLPDTFRNMPVVKATPATIEATYRSLAADGWTPHRVRRVHELLHGAFKRAYRLGTATSDPMGSVRPPIIPTTAAGPARRAVTREGLERRWKRAASARWRCR